MKFVLSVLTMMMFITLGLYEGVYLLVGDTRFQVMTQICSVLGFGSLFLYAVTRWKDGFLPRTRAAWLLSALFWFIANPAFISYGPAICISIVLCMALGIAIKIEEINGWCSMSFFRQFASALIGLIAVSAILIFRYLDTVDMITVFGWAGTALMSAFFIAPGWRAALKAIPATLQPYK